MKTFVYFILFFSGIFMVSAQNYQNGYNDHEIRFNMGRFLATSTIEGSYEYYFTPDTSIGGTLFFNGDAYASTGNFGIGPNLRAYFGYNPKSGIFAEAFGLYYTGDIDNTNNLGTRNNDYSTTALGLGLGRKWSTFGQKLTLEISAGLGRNINSKEFQNSFMYRAGLSLGFRF
ncbi:hypothetical protein JQC67_01910 [Aurantibacter crassamenti]|uniref:hypothetical protein n=1 Tax=Aurantibacter crassamenti TaxID=1837375 RepID=UPI00193A0FB7|nr:hypothetical protein [Aurantibacter crassamenti]MBM1104882.1 hypothetical protein [Aurantibacter crassamenti]